MDLEKQVDREENQDELHFILLLLILLIRQSSSEGNPSAQTPACFCKRAGRTGFKSQFDQRRYTSKCHRKRSSD